ncbi:uncharacterized mitochondrial protein-like protein [Tanacetum coccineum]
MHKKFQMSSMGELTFFLGLQVNQREDGIFISQDKYVTEILKKFGFTDVKTASTPMETQKPFLKDEDGEELDVHLFRSMIGSLMYLTSSRTDIMFAVCTCARYQVNPKVSHLHAMKRIFRYLKDQPKLGLWYPKDSPFDLVAYTDSNYAGASLYRKSTTGVDRKKIIITEATIRRDLQLEDADDIDCLPNATIFEQLTLMGYEKLSQKLTFYKAFFSPQWKFLIHTILQCLSAKTTAWNEFSSTCWQILDVSKICASILDNQLEGMIKHNRIYITPSHAKMVFANMKRQGKDFSSRRPTKPKRKDIEIPQSSVPMENVADGVVYEKRDDSLERATTTATGLDAEQDIGVNTPRSCEDSLQLKELMEFCTKLQQRVPDLENIKNAQAHEITSLKKRVKKLKRKKKSRTYGLKRLYKVGLSARIDSSDDEASLGDQEDASKQGWKIHDIDADEDITLENVHDADMFGVHDLDGDEVFVETKEPVVNATTTTSTIPVSAAKDLSDVDMTLAQALAKLKSTKPKAVTTAATTTTNDDKGKGIKVEEPLKMKKKDQVLFDEQEAIRIQAQFDEEERIAREKEEANDALIAQRNDIQDKVKTDYELAQRLQAEEQEELTIE